MGVATQNRWLTRGLDPELKADRLGNYICTLRKELLSVSLACGICHPSLLTDPYIEILDGRYGSSSLFEVFRYRDDWGLPSEADIQEIRRVMEDCFGIDGPAGEERCLGSTTVTDR